ncbi:hypothetical protein [Tahibacter amnicola]|uniref:Uncharacterized protein n=1 Tax=Tahibacter amnicola TaxID=2976241 RepID=A0ABY6BLR1_9GAMM|nr:hypothetical protein [Tahibacter amnicola]UXI70417.1 hypothetical protein N4264_12505 [Tahibacter amnicola]
MRPLLCLGAALVCGAVAASPPPRFPPNAVWHRDISAAPLHPDSGAMLQSLSNLGGWGNGNKFQIDLSLHVLNDPGGTAPMIDIVPNPEEYYTGACDNHADAARTFPLPAGGAIEGQNGYSCDNLCADDSCDDCHLLVVRGRILYEAYSSNVVNNTLVTRCAVRWDLDRVYPPEGRGDQCTSADAAGFPIAPLLFNADEVQAAVNANGDLGHAIRFILPNPRMAAATFVHPATHGGAPSGPSTTVPYGVRMRLKSSFNMANYNAAGKVLLRTMQRYGIVLADGGNIAVTGESDAFTTAKWATLGVTTVMFNPGVGNPPVTVNDFEIIQTGARIPLTYNCVRTPEDFLFIDHFQY